MAKNLTLRSFHPLLTLHLHKFHFQSKETPKRQCFNWKKTVLQLREGQDLLAIQTDHQQKEQYRKLLFPKVTFFHSGFAWIEIGREDLSVSSEGKKGSVASCVGVPSDCTIWHCLYPKHMFSANAASIIQQRIIHKLTEQDPSQGCLIMEENRNSICKLDVITRNSLASNASEIYVYKAKVLHASRFQAVDSFRVRE